MQWGLAGLLQEGVPQETAAIDTFLRSQENASDHARVDTPPQPTQDASELSDVSDEEREPTSAHQSWVPTPHLAQLSGYNRLHVAMHAIHEAMAHACVLQVVADAIDMQEREKWTHRCGVNQGAPWMPEWEDNRRR